MKATLQLMKIQSAWIVEDPEDVVFDVGPKINKAFRYTKTEGMVNGKTSTVKKIKTTKEGKVFSTVGAMYKLVKDRNS